MTKQLQNAIITAGRETIEFQNGGTDYPVQVADLPDASLLRIFDYGKRMFNDYVNSAKGQGKDPETAAKEWLAKAKAGELGTRQGGARISPLEKAIRGIVADYLKAAGWDAKAAAKDAKDPSAAFEDMLRMQIARGKGVPVAEVEEDKVQEAMVKNWPKVEQKAQAIVDLQQGGLDIDLG